MSCVLCAAPNLLAGMDSKGDDKTRVGMYGTLGPAGFTTTIFATSKQGSLPSDLALPTNTLLGVSVSSVTFMHVFCR